MTPSKKRYFVKKLSDEARNCRFMVGKGRMENTFHTMKDCTVGAQITGIDTVDVANSMGDLENAGSGVLGVVVPSQLHSYVRELNENHSEEDAQVHKDILRDLSPKNVEKNLQFDKSSGQCMVTVGSKVYDYLLEHCKAYGHSPKQIQDPALMARGKVHLTNKSGKLLGADLESLYNRAKKYQHKKLDVVLTPHAETSNWEALHRGIYMDYKSGPNAYKKNLVSYPDQKKQYKAGFKLTIYIKFV